MELWSLRLLYQLQKVHCSRIKDVFTVLPRELSKHRRKTSKEKKKKQGECHSSRKSWDDRGLDSHLGWFWHVLSFLSCLQSAHSQRPASSNRTLSPHWDLLWPLSTPNVCVWASSIILHLQRALQSQIHQGLDYSLILPFPFLSQDYSPKQAQRFSQWQSSYPEIMIGSGGVFLFLHPCWNERFVI